MEKLKGAKTPLEKRVQSILNSNVEDYNSMKSLLNDLFEHGCVSGMIGELVYYTDTVKWYNRYKDEINELLKEAIWQCGGKIKDVFGKGWDEEDPLCLETHNQNLLAWFSFEETARILADRNNIEV